MGKKKKCVCPEPGLTAPFFLLTYGDMMTLLLTFFVLLYAMSTLQILKFQAQIGAMKGALGISEFYAHAPMQRTLPAPSVKESPRAIAKSAVKPTILKPLAEYARSDLTEPVQHDENEKIKLIKVIGQEGNMQVHEMKDEIILVLPSYGLFEKGAYTINPTSLSVQKVTAGYHKLARQVAKLTNYEVHFVGHTDVLPLKPTPGQQFPRNNMELGFLRAVAVYTYFFKSYLGDRTRIVFASQGDNVPIIPMAKLDSQHRKNRRVEIHLRRKD